SEQHTYKESALQCRVNEVARKFDYYLRIKWYYDHHIYQEALQFILRARQTVAVPWFELINESNKTPLWYEELVHRRYPTRRTVMENLERHAVKACHCQYPEYHTALIAANSSLFMNISVQVKEISTL
uniref:Uncharacterized protein n=1 Tax=Romanomermis culicivorax TaxID=13658 RepID=A0A915J403_ROMCU